MNFFINFLCTIPHICVFFYKSLGFFVNSNFKMCLLTGKYFIVLFKMSIKITNSFGISNIKGTHYCFIDNINWLICILSYLSKENRCLQILAIEFSR